MLSALILLALGGDPPLIVVDRDNVEITRSCHVHVSAAHITDSDGNGAIHITASGITVEFDEQPLQGAGERQLPDTFAGTGIVITGHNVTLSGAHISGYKVGIHALKADGLRLRDCDVSDNFHQHLKSTPQAEDQADWLWPHANDKHEWAANYGAGVWVQEADHVTLARIRARHTQNGILLDAVNDSNVVDCDCSFLSGWGLAMWRSNRNLISRNAFDFCIRGYSHGVYNRGQDSAGILMFEQCCDNVIAENSATHCGDGFFGFAGKEALGEVNPRPDDLEWYKDRGCNRNLLHKNEFSYAAAHGIEMTFSFHNWFSANQIIGNSICGIWGGYCHCTDIEHNVIASNGVDGAGHARGGIGIEHGYMNLIDINDFSGNSCGVSLWSDDNAALLQLPWAKANHHGSTSNQIVSNTFRGGHIAVTISRSDGTVLSPGLRVDGRPQLLIDEYSKKTLSDQFQGAQQIGTPPLWQAGGKAQPVGARNALAGRENIIMTEWGPWDHDSPLLQLAQHTDGSDEYRLLGAAGDADVQSHLRVDGNVRLDINGDRIRVSPKADHTITPYELRYSSQAGAPALTMRGTLTGGAWKVWTFPSSVDPREDTNTWRRDGEAKHHELLCEPLDLPFGNAGMSEARHLPVVLPRDHFGCIATRTLTFPKGKWRITTTSDDGIRVWLDNQVVIDDWTWHAPKTDTYDFEALTDRTMSMRVEYFELDGYAVLQLGIAPGD